MDNKAWKEKVLCESKNGYDRMPESEREAMNAYCEGYKAFLDAGKTERECVIEGVRLAEAQGFRPYVRGMALQPYGFTWLPWIQAAGGDITIIRRDYYGHHPHGLDDPRPLADFILQYYPAPLKRKCRHAKFGKIRR